MTSFSENFGETSSNVNDTDRGKLPQKFKTRTYTNKILATSDYYLQNQCLEFRLRCLNKVIHQINRNWRVSSFSKFYRKIWVSFCLIILKPTKRTKIPLKTIQVIIKNILARLRNQSIFIRQPLEILYVLITFLLKQVFWRIKNFFW